MSDQQRFIEENLPYARKASTALNIPVSDILAQLGIESDWGRSALAKATGNLGGIKYTSNAPAQWQGYANYNGSKEAFFKDYVRVFGLSFYEKVRSAISPEDTAKALGNSPYAESGYTYQGQKGGSIINVINQYNLKQYDDPNTANSTVPVGSVFKAENGNLVIVFF